MVVNDTMSLGDPVMGTDLLNIVSISMSEN
jgi:hypothetical protein